MAVIGDDRLYNQLKYLYQQRVRAIAPTSAALCDAPAADLRPLLPSRLQTHIRGTATARPAFLVGLWLIPQHPLDGAAAAAQSQAGIRVVKLPRSGGVVTRSTQLRKDARVQVLC